MTIYEYDFDDDEVMYWMHEIEYAVFAMPWWAVTVESVVEDIHDLYDETGISVTDELPKMCEAYLYRYSDPFDGIGSLPHDLAGMTESDINLLLKAVTAKGKFYKAGAAEIDSYLEQLKQGSQAKP